jgi:ATP-dependent Clp protease adaptor protein ClpS
LPPNRLLSIERAEVRLFQPGFLLSADPIPLGEQEGMAGRAGGEGDGVFWRSVISNGLSDLTLQRLVLDTKYLSPCPHWAQCLAEFSPGLSSGPRRFNLACAACETGPVRYGRVTVLKMSKDDDKVGDGTNTGVVVKARPKTKKPAMYKVIMLNDDYTPMEFVVHVLERFFSKNRDEATTIMMHVHQRGVGICGVYTYEVAETKVTQVMDFARQHQHPLQCTLEKA